MKQTWYIFPFFLEKFPEIHLNKLNHLNTLNLINSWQKSLNDKLESVNNFQPKNTNYLGKYIQGLEVYTL